jgi:hypothetical protein
MILPLISEQMNYEFTMCYESDFYYDYSTIDSIENPFNALKMSKYDGHSELPNNIYFDVPFEKKYLDLIVNVKYVTFHGKITSVDFYEYLRNCHHYHVGFNMNKSISIPELVLSDHIESLLVADLHSRVPIVANNLRELYCGCEESCNFYRKTLPTSVKKLMLTGFVVEPILIDTIETLILVVGPENIYANYFSDKLKELILIVDSEMWSSMMNPDVLKMWKCKPKLRVQSSLKNRVKIYNPDNVPYELEWFEHRVLSLPTEYQDIVKVKSDKKMEYSVQWI